MNLSTTYLGFELPHPVVPGASPLVDNLDTVRRLEDAGAPMLVMHSLFEEQIVLEERAVTRALDAGGDSHAEAQSYLPLPEDFTLGPDEYLEQVRKVKDAVAVPVIASLNGTSAGGWLRYATSLEQAGADGLELNLYEVPLDFSESGAQIERREVDVVRAVKAAVRIPVAVKLSPFYTSLGHFARQLEEAGADALVLFNRFYHPDIDPEKQELHRVNPVGASDLLLRLRWVGVLSGRVRPSLAVTGGVQTAVDVVKAVMAGAHATQMVTALLRHGPDYLAVVLADLKRWLEEHEFASLRQMQGSMSLRRCGEPQAYHRANYVKVLQSWQEE